MVIKAFIANNFIFYNEKKHVVKDLNKDKDLLVYTKKPPE